MRTLGRTGIQVSPYCLGTMMFGQAGNPDHDDCVRIIHRGLGAGINVVDTADVYGPHGQSEEIEETLSALSDLVRSGKVRAIGSSNAPAWVPRHLTDERKLDAVEQLIPLAEQAGLSLTHLAVAFAISHPGVTTAIIGPRTMEQLEDLLAGAAVTLDDEILDRIDQIVAPGTDLGQIDVSHTPPAIARTALRRRPADERTAA
jgi:aryl-alcohol dehydrogenase-like predicted oxidoreductase